MSEVSHGHDKAWVCGGRIGDRAAGRIIGGKRLLDLVNKRFDAAQHILLDCELRPGETIGPVPAGAAVAGRVG